MPSRRSQFLVKFFEKGKRVSKEDLIEKGIYRPEAVFGNFLVNLCHTTSGIPDFLARCVARIETMLDTVGIYRVNGDAALVQKLRFDLVIFVSSCLAFRHILPFKMKMLG